MMISFKDSYKFIGVFIVSFCAVLVCTFFLNYYIDILPLKDQIPFEIKKIYNAQLATAKMTCGITGGFLSVIVAIMLCFYIKIYIDNHHSEIGIFKAMGYSNLKIAKSFVIFSITILIGCGLGFAFGWVLMPFIYKNLSIEGMINIQPTFHFNLFIFLVCIPTLVFSIIVFLYSMLSLRKPALLLIKGNNQLTKRFKISKNNKDRSFNKEMKISTLKSQKIQAFFVAFSCFCFSAMVQMGLSMENLVKGTMSILILVIGLILSVVSMFMAMTSLIKNNEKNIAMMKTMGFLKKECFTCIFSSYIPLAFLGFVIGTFYQYGLLSLMINLVFKDVENVPDYHFNFPVLFVTLLLFIVCYSGIFIFYLQKAYKVSVKKIMLE